MSKRIQPADKAMTKAKKNSLARKQRVAKELRELCSQKIDEMVQDGVVSILVPMNEEMEKWGLAIIKTELEGLGYQLILEEDEESDTPDLYISIEHLK